MDQLTLSGTEDTPMVMLDKSQCLFKIAGRSLPEDVASFYRPVISWLELFSEDPTNNFNFEVNLEYFNTASSKVLLDIFMKLEEIYQGGCCSVSVNWLYSREDDCMMEAGEEYKDLVEVPFKLVAY